MLTDINSFLGGNSMISLAGTSFAIISILYSVSSVFTKKNGYALLASKIIFLMTLFANYIYLNNVENQLVNLAIVTFSSAYLLKAKSLREISCAVIPFLATIYLSPESVMLGFILVTLVLNFQDSLNKILSIILFSLILFFDSYSGVILNLLIMINIALSTNLIYRLKKTDLPLLLIFPILMNYLMLGQTQWYLLSVISIPALLILKRRYDLGFAIIMCVLGIYLKDINFFCFSLYFLLNNYKTQLQTSVDPSVFIEFNRITILIISAYLIWAYAIMKSLLLVGLIGIMIFIIKSKYFNQKIATLTHENILKLVLISIVVFRIFTHV